MKGAASTKKVKAAPIFLYFLYSLNLLRLANDQIVSMGYFKYSTFKLLSALCTPIKLGYKKLQRNDYCSGCEATITLSK